MTNYIRLCKKKNYSPFTRTYVNADKYTQNVLRSKPRVSQTTSHR